MTRLHVALLGPLHVIVHDTIADGFGYDKVRALLVYLLLEGRRPLGRDALAALLWPDAPAGAARKGLRNALATLRQAIGDTAAEPAVILTTRDTLQLHPQADLSADVYQLAAHLASVEQHAHPPGPVCEQCAERLAQAVALYRGGFAEQIQVADSVAWEEWALLIRERLHAQLLDALARLMAYHEARGEDERARQYAWRALALEAWDETAHRCLMRIYARGGQRSAAVAQYERCRKVLADELGIEPAAETTKLYQQISARQIERDRKPAPAAHAPAKSSSVPRPLTPLIGRERELTALGALLLQPQLRLLTLVGPPGVGKSRVALALAAAAEPVFASGCVFVSLAAIRDPDLVMAAIAKALDLRETSDEPLAIALAAYLRSKQILLLLDNCEQVAAAAVQIASLLQYVPGAKVLATSRVPLRISGEHEQRIAPLPYPSATASREALADAPAVALFLQRAAAVGLGADAGASLTAVAQLCARLDGLPLAIELAAAQCRYYSPAMLLGLLEQRMLRLDRGMADAAPHQRALESAIAWSVALLSAEQQALFQQIALFVGGCSIDGVAAVSADRSLATLAGDLTVLLDHSLLQSEGNTSGQVRYTMLKPIREHALALLLASEQADQAIDRFIAYCLTMAERATAELSGGDQPGGIARLQHDYSNLVAAIEWALGRGQAEAALRLVGALGWFWDLRGQMTEGRRWLAQALALPGRVEPGIRARALASAGLLAIDQNDPVAALALFQEALPLYGESGDAAEHAYALCSLGRVYRIQGAYETAAAYFEQGLALARAAGDLPTIGYAHYNLGRIAYQHGAYADARARLLQSIGAFEQTRNVWGLALARCNLGRVAARQHDLIEAGLHLRAGLAHFTAINDLWGIALAHCKLGWLACAQSELESARASFAESLAYAKQVSYQEGIADALTGLARVAQLQERPEAMVMLLGAAGCLLDRLGESLNTLDRDEYDQALASARATIDGAVFAAAWARGRDTPIETLLDLLDPGLASRTAP